MAHGVHGFKDHRDSDMTNKSKIRVGPPYVEETRPKCKAGDLIMYRFQHYLVVFDNSIPRRGMVMSVVSLGAIPEIVDEELAEDA